MKAKLDLQKVSIQGRSSELHRIDFAYQRLTKSNNVLLKGQAPEATARHLQGASIIVVEGQPGTGKSFLVESWRSTMSPQDMVFACSKFDRLQKDRASYETISRVVSQLCDAIHDKQLLLERLKALMGDQLEQVLDTLSFFPSYLRSSESEFDGSRQSLTSLDGSMEGFTLNEGFAFDRFEFLFRQFFGCIGSILLHQSHSLPFVILLDDIQHVDENSAKILEALVGDYELKGFLLILTTNSTSDYLKLLREKAEKSEKSYDMIQVGNLLIEDTNALISEVTKARKEDTFSLAELAIEKTSGNPFFVLQFLHVLSQREILVFSMRTYTWQWDLEAARRETQLSDNVAEFVRERVAALTPQEQHHLKIASYLGASFHLEDAAFVRRAMEISQGAETLVEAARVDVVSVVVDDSVCRLESLIFQKGVDEGLLDEKLEGVEIKFAHESIQRFFLSNQVSLEFLWRIGAAILARAMFVSPVKDNLLFAAVEVLNRSTDAIFDLESKLYLAKMNLEAARAAKRISAFFPAASYLECGIKLVTSTEQEWAPNNRDLTRRLFRRAVEIELVCGRHEQCQEQGKILLENAQKDADSIYAYYAIAKSLRVQGKGQESIDVLLCALKLLGEVFPPKQKAFHQIMRDKRMRHLMKGKTVSFILSLPTMSDKICYNRMRLLSTLLVTVYNVLPGKADWFMIRLISHRMIVHTLQHGLCEFSPLAFALYAFRLVEERKFKDAYQYGEVCNKLINRLNATANLPLATFFLTAFVSHLHQPMHFGLRHLKRSYQIGMESGQTEMALLCASTDVAYQLTVAYPLTGIFHESRRFVYMCRQYNQDSMEGEFLLICQLAANLSGESASSTEFDGAFLKAEGKMRDLKNGPYWAYYKYLQVLCFTYMADWKRAIAGMDELQKNRKKSESSHYTFIMNQVYSGIIYLKAYNQTKDARYKERGTSSIKFLQKWMKQGAINIPPCLWFVQAQMAMADGSGFINVKALFDKAISGLHRCAFRHLEALACEILTTFAEDCGELEWMSHYINKALQLYLEWGAMAKVAQLKILYPQQLRNIKVDSESKSNVRRSFEEESRFRRSSWWSDEASVASITSA